MVVVVVVETAAAVAAGDDDTVLVVVVAAAVGVTAVPTVVDTIRFAVCRPLRTPLSSLLRFAVVVPDDSMVAS